MRLPNAFAGRLIDYANTPGIIATLVSARLATLHELDTAYGVKDAYDLLEIHMIDQANENIIRGGE